jgi:hypothetical protein
MIRQNFAESRESGLSALARTLQLLTSTDGQIQIQ